MINRKNTFIIGILIFLIPFLGLPTFWKNFLYIITGLFLIISSISFPEVRKPIKPKTKKEKQSEISIESIPIYPRDNITEISTVETIKIPRKKSSKINTVK